MWLERSLFHLLTDQPADLDQADLLIKPLTKPFDGAGSVLSLVFFMYSLILVSQNL